MIYLEKINGEWFIQNDNVEGDFKQALKTMKDKQTDKAALEKKQKDIIKVAKSYVNKLEQEQSNNIQSYEMTILVQQRKNINLVVMIEIRLKHMH